MAVRDFTLQITDVRHLADACERAAIREALRRLGVVFINGKGGVGKSSCASNFAVNCAAIGQRTLLMELDPQGNHAEDLGHFRDTSVNDQGKSQADAVLSGGAIEPTGEVRERLFVAPGGEELERVHQELYIQQRVGDLTGDQSWMYMYARSLAQCAKHFDRIILDVAPGSSVLQLQALVAADMVVIPSRSDPSSRKGLRAVHRRFSEAREFNEGLDLLGIVLFGTGSRSYRLKDTIRRALEQDLQDDTKVLSMSIRHVEAAAIACRTYGKVAQELAFDDRLDESLKRSVIGLAHDYRAVTAEIWERIASLIAEEAA